MHLRFRLGGSCFPPILFYKIYTHRPVADIGAFGPRNYAAEVPVASVDLSSLPAPQPSAGTGHSLASTGTRHAPSCLEAEFQIPAAQRRFVRPDGSIGLRSAIGWYQRRENNGWRPVNEVRMLDSEDDCAPAAQRPATHFKASVRREERARRQRQRHCEWMAALYRYALGSSLCCASQALALMLAPMHNGAPVSQACPVSVKLRKDTPNNIAHVGSMRNASGRGSGAEAKRAAKRPRPRASITRAPCRALMAMCSHGASTWTLTRTARPGATVQRLWAVRPWCLWMRARTWPRPMAQACRRVIRGLRGMRGRCGHR